MTATAVNQAPVSRPARAPKAPSAVERLAAEMGRATGDLARHPRDGWVFAEPFPMTRGQVRKFHGLIRAMCPTEPHVPDLEARIEDQVRRMMRYMQPFIAVGFMAALEVLDAAPLFMGKWKRLQHLPQAEASEVIGRLADAPIGPLSDLVVAARAATIAPFYDLDEVIEHVGFRPVPFMRERVALRQRLVAGGAGAARETDAIGPFSATAAPRPELTTP